MFKQHQNLHFVFLDIKDDKNVELLITKTNPDYFINFAALIVIFLVTKSGVLNIDS